MTEWTNHILALRHSVSIILADRAIFGDSGGKPVSEVDSLMYFFCKVHSMKISRI